MFLLWLGSTVALIGVTKLMLQPATSPYDNHGFGPHAWMIWLAYPGWSLWLILTLLWATGQLA
jgi:hypothetical protein